MSFFAFEWFCIVLLFHKRNSFIKANLCLWFSNLHLAIPSILGCWSRGLCHSRATVFDGLCAFALCAPRFHPVVWFYIGFHAELSLALCGFRELHRGMLVSFPVLNTSITFIFVPDYFWIYPTFSLITNENLTELLIAVVFFWYTGHSFYFTSSLTSFSLSFSSLGSELIFFLLFHMGVDPQSLGSFGVKPQSNIITLLAINSVTNALNHGTESRLKGLRDMISWYQKVSVLFLLIDLLFVFIHLQLNLAVSGTLQSFYALLLSPDTLEA